MCGISGFINHNLSFENQNSITNHMTSSLMHRGPDDSGIWIQKNNLLSFGHRRLSIVDLSKHGKQPMISNSGNLVISFNGEIYNFREIRDELIRLNHKFISETDTEVILASIEQWGLRYSLEKFEGMFAFALWNEREKTLTLIKDRFGEKPLYYGWQENFFLFSSEIKSMKKHPAWQGCIDLNSLGLFFKYSYVPTPNTIFNKIKKLSSGSFIEVSFKNDKWHTSNEVKWWEPKIKKNDKIDYFHAKNTVENMLIDIIDKQKEADVSVGTFLSGGIDSSLITALMQLNSNKSIKTFTIGFEYNDYDESEHARAVAKYLKTDHHEQIVTTRDAQDVIPNLPEIYDEPFADSSQIPTYLVSKLAKKHITVGLTGDGGDEMFCGYNRYLWAPKLLKSLKYYPHFFKKTLTTLLDSTSVNTQSILYKTASVFLTKQFQTSTPIEKIEKIKRSLLLDNEYDFYNSLESIWFENNPCLNFINKNEINRKKMFSNYSGDFLEKMVLSDINNYLLDDILVKVDRAAMANSLETRLPFLNHNLCDFSLSLPDEMKIDSQNQKIILKDIISKYIPKSILEKPKSGFGVPLDSWFRNSLKEWVCDTLSSHKIKYNGFLDNSIIQKALQDHMSGRKNRQHELWNVIVWQNWYDQQ